MTPSENAALSTRKDGRTFSSAASSPAPSVPSMAVTGMNTDTTPYKVNYTMQFPDVRSTSDGTTDTFLDNFLRGNRDDQPRKYDGSILQALGMMKVFVAEPDASPQLRGQIESLLGTHHNAMDLVDKIQTLREQLAEYRSRSGELNAQLVSLRAVRTGGDLMAALRAKLAEMSERVQKTTIALVDTQEKLMLARVKFQNQLADLRLTDATAPAVGTRWRGGRAHDLCTERIADTVDGPND